MPGFGPQTTVTLFPDIGLEGQVAEGGFSDISTGIADAGLELGLALVLGANGYQSVKVPSASGDVAHFKGFSIYKALKEPASPHYAAKDTVPLLRVGKIWIVPQGDLVDDGQVFLIYSGANAGKLRGDTGSGGNAALQLTRCTCIKGGTAGTPCLVAVNLP